MLERSTKKLAFAGPWITEKELAYTRDATLNGFYENFDGYTKKLEQKICEYLGVKHALATHCCTVALHLACEALGLNEDDEVICTDFSWVATAYAISYTRAKPVFVDIEKETWCIDPEAIKKAITPKTKAIMLVHSFGVPANMSAIMEIAQKNNLKVIEDAAPALGSFHQGRKTGTFGDFACFSFQGAKLTVSGEGGVIVTNNSELFEKVRLLANMGRTDRVTRFWSDQLGYQYTIANLTAALALAQVERVDELLDKKRKIFQWYFDRLKNIEGIEFIRERSGDVANYCYPSIILGPRIQVKRDLVLKHLEKLNVHCRPAFPRMSQFPMYKDSARFENPNCKNAEENGISLAGAANLTEQDVDFVCKALNEAIEMSRT